MADSEARQKELMTLELKAMIRKIETFRTSMPDKLRIMQRFYDAVFEAGMRAGEIAQREKIRNAARAEYDKDPDQTAADCEDTTPKAIYLNGFIKGIEAVYKSALPAAPEEKKS